MRQNLPVTDQENPVRDSDVIISRTDLKGRIVYVSPDFARLSEFAPEDMIGKAHNIVRHPDVPPAVFADLWETIKAGNAWRGIVKNRASSGNFYWVEAMVTPVHENGAITGYMSVRRRAGEAEIRRWEALYRKAWRRDRLEQSRFRRILERFVPILTGTAAAIRRIEGALGLLLRGDLIGLRDAHEQKGAGFLFRRIYDSVNSLSVSLWGILFQVRTQNEAQQDLARRLADSAERMSDNASSQAAAAEEISSAVEQLTASFEVTGNNVNKQKEDIKLIAGDSRDLAAGLGRARESAGGLAGVSKQCSDLAGDSERKVGQAIQSMKEIRNSSEEIGNIIDIIRDISERINLLSLNAAIEAARAGEQGRGFAVVADEISRLADQTAHSVKEIGNYVNATVVSVTDGTAEVERAVDGIREVGDSVRRMEVGVTEIAGIVEEEGRRSERIEAFVNSANQFAVDLTRAVDEERRSAREIADSIMSLSNDTQAISDEALEIKTIGADVRRGGEQVSELIRHFRV